MKILYTLPVLLIILASGCKKNCDACFDPDEQYVSSVEAEMEEDPSVYQVDHAASGTNGWTVNTYGNNVVRSEGSYNNGVPNGHWKFYHSNGQLRKEGNLNNGQMSGDWKFFYDNGRLRAEGNFNNGVKSGWWKFYDPAGFLESEGNYNYGVKSGEWKIYLSNGRYYTSFYY